MTSAKIQWLYLAQEARKQPQGAVGMPGVEQTARTLHQARGTVLRDRLLLRICRWISAVRQVRDPQSGRFLGQVYALHGEPVQLHAAIAYDAHYLALLEAAQAHPDKRVQRAARANIVGIHERIRAGEDPLAPIDPVAVRLSTAQALETGWGTAWCVPLQRLPAAAEHGSAGAPGPDFEPGVAGSSNLGPGAQPGPNFGPGSQVIDSTASPNFGPGRCSSSNSKTTTTTNRPRARMTDARTALEWPAAFDDKLRRLQRNHLLNELAGLKRLRAAQGGDPAQASLDRQITALEARLCAARDT